MPAKQRTRSPHPGVVLKPRKLPSGRTAWRARYYDPDKCQVIYETLDAAAVPNAKARRQWAKDKAKQLAQRRMEIEGGAARHTFIPIKDAVAQYYADHPRLRPQTLRAYKIGTDKLLAWAARSRLRTVDKLTRRNLLSFRASLIREPKRKPDKGGKRGEWQATDESRSPVTINRELRAVRTVLGYLRDKELIPHLSSDDLRTALKREKESEKHPDFLDPAECRQLLEAALRHDAETFDLTRAEHRAGFTQGATPRYQPIAPFIAVVLLTGMRFGEAFDLDWKSIHMDAPDHEGNPVGEIRFGGTGTKTRKRRTIGLEVAPSVRTLLAALKLRHGGKGRVFDMTRGTIKKAAERLHKTYGAPEHFTWQTLRRTCGTYLTNAPGIFGAASVFMSARQLGHSVQIAEKHYLGVYRGIPREARTLEEAMQIEDVMRRVVESVGGEADAGGTVVAMG